MVSDIQANLPAFKTVLDHMPEVDELACLGDIVGYNSCPAECVDLVQEECSYVLQGNHDRNVGNAEEYSSNHQAEAGIRYAEKELSGD